MLLKGKRIFIVEDNVQNRVVFQMALIIQGATIEFERWGWNAIQILQQQDTVDLIILDLMLKEQVSGYDIFEGIRKLPKFDKVPIVAVSAAEAAIALPKTKKMGFSGFIAKPIDVERFPKQIAQVIAGSQVWVAGERFQEVEE